MSKEFPSSHLFGSSPQSSSNIGFDDRKRRRVQGTGAGGWSNGVASKAIRRHHRAIGASEITFLIIQTIKRSLPLSWDRSTIIRHSALASAAVGTFTLLSTWLA
ncbi:hypothetical protein [Agrobacterium sp. DSM 25558]|jgi:hypothetical protein|uniref:hypothetical protein n=1 Tax=Agrobacterium sp. DSM 25558 TaxID=1907665 RepID=UPI001178A888|nr:hypothetical protein [Agrobacterium sp. DSM 25558]